LKILVAIAHYGNDNRACLERLIAEYRSMPWPVDIVVLSEAPKPLPAGVAIAVGLPDSSNPWSLPFAHRKLFAEQRDRYDLFVYSEDDTLVRRHNIEAFLDATQRLAHDEIAGFLRSETDARGQQYVSSVHSHFRWSPCSIVTRGGETFARFSNDHAACYMVTRAQLETAIRSGGFLVAPHNGRYDMLCSAATDVYTQCGLRRLICISRLQTFILPHLPNKYLGRMGVPLDTVVAQVESLQRIHVERRWSGSLFDAESRLPFGLWSKDLYETPDPGLLALIPRRTRHLLSVGCGWGATEAALVDAGIDVTAVPIDAVFADVVRRRGVRTLEGPLREALAGADEGSFDCVLATDSLHLIGDPVGWLKALRPYLTAGSGSLVWSVPNTLDVLTLRSKLGGFRNALARPVETWGVTPVGRKRLKTWLHSAGFIPETIIPVLSDRRRLAANATFGALRGALAYGFLGRARLDTAIHRTSAPAQASTRSHRYASRAH
jgi:2-polyprenyl-3-methyl-5-hydroxy-6-metoxy-1,4-benzoquinol methylase